MKRILLASALLALAGPAMTQSSPELPRWDIRAWCESHITSEFYPKIHEQGVEGCVMAQRINYQTLQMYWNSPVTRPEYKTICLKRVEAKLDLDNDLYNALLHCMLSEPSQ
jgi:hypothetical protein